MYPYFLFTAIHHLIAPDFLCPASKLSRQSNGRSNPEAVGSIPTEVKRLFLYLVWLPDSPLLGLTPTALFMGLIST